MKHPVSMTITAKPKTEQEPKTSPLFDDNDKCFSPYLLKLTACERLRVTSCQDYTDVWSFFCCFFLEEAASQTTRYRQATVELFSSRLLLLVELTSAQISGIDFARASTKKPAVIAVRLS